MKIDVNFKDNLSQELYLIRGIAIVLVVVGHVIGYNRQYGMRNVYNSDLSALGWFCDFINTFHMPVFFMVSGIAFAVFSNKNTIYSKFFSSKLQKLVIPLLCWSPTYFIFQSLSKGKSFSLLDVIESIIYPYEIFWFIHVLIFASLLSFIYFKLLKSPWMYLGLSIALFLVSLPLPETLIYKYFHWNIFYAFGVILGFYLHNIRLKLELLSLKILFILELFSLILMLVTKYLIPFHDEIDLLRIINGCLAFGLLYLIFTSASKISLDNSLSKSLEKVMRSATERFIYIGSLSMVIYLFHGYFTRITVIVLIKILGLPDQYLYFILASTMGILGPIFLYRLLQNKSNIFLYSIGENKK